MTASSVSTTVHDHLPPPVAGRTVILATTDPNTGKSILRHLHELGAGRIVVLGPPMFQPLAAEVNAELVEVELAGADPTLTQQAWAELLADPPPGLRSLIAARDPDGTALVLVAPQFAPAELLGRPVFDAHPPLAPSR